MSEMHFRQRGSFTKIREKIQNLKKKKPRKLRCIFQNRLDKVCFQHEKACSDFKDLPRRTASDKVFHYKALILLKIHNMMDNKKVLLHFFAKFLIKSLLAELLKVKLSQTINQQMNQKNQLLENLKNIEYIHLLEMTFGVQT